MFHSGIKTGAPRAATRFKTDETARLYPSSTCGKLGSRKDSPALKRALGKCLRTSLYQVSDLQPQKQSPMSAGFDLSACNVRNDTPNLFNTVKYAYGHSARTKTRRLHLLALFLKKSVDYNIDDL